MSARIGARLGTPFVLAAAVVLLVSAVGTLSLLSSYAALCRLGRSEARAELRTESTRLEASIGGALGNADALLDRLIPRVRSQDTPPTGLLTVLHELSTARPGLTWMSVSFADGTFEGVYRDETGELRGQESVLTPTGGLERTFLFGEQGKPRQVGERPTSYDPRARVFYQQAVARRKRVWSAPYPFLPSLRTGVSRAEPVLDAQGKVLAVATVDFDASQLTPLLGEGGTHTQKRAVVAHDGSLLASTGFALPPRSSWPRDRSLRVSDVNDPLLTAMVQARARVERKGPQALRVHDRTYHVDAVHVVELEGAPIVLYSARDEAELYHQAKLEARRGLTITAIVALLAIALAFVISASIARLKEARDTAEQAVRKVEHELLELGSYELLQLLGGGAMGEVYRARHKLLSREAALKLIRVSDDAESDAELQRLFLQEARRLASMRSIHTVSVYDFGVASDGRCYLAMELLHGLDLDKLVRRFGPQPSARVAAILAQICDSLAEAHEQGLVHQDIKPANVFLCRLAESLDVVKVLDFGIARAVGPRGARLSRAEGTPGFMSPEQILGDPVGPLADLYGVGALGFFLLAGTPPFRGGQSDLVQLEQVEGPVPRLPEQVLTRCPPELVQLITRCLAKTPEHRPVSARLLGDALRDIARNHPAGFSEEDRARFWRQLDSEPEPVDSSMITPSHVRTLAARVHTLSTKRLSRG